MRYFTVIIRNWVGYHHFGSFWQINNSKGPRKVEMALSKQNSLSVFATCIPNMDKLKYITWCLMSRELIRLRESVIFWQPCNNAQYGKIWMHCRNMQVEYRILFQKLSVDWLMRKIKEFWLNMWWTDQCGPWNQVVQNLKMSHSDQMAQKMTKIIKMAKMFKIPKRPHC